MRPASRKQRARELIRFTNDVRVWQEDEEWGTVVAGILKDRGLATGKVGWKSGCGSSSPTGFAPRRRRCKWFGDAGDGRLPDVQVSGRDRADAARQRHHDRRLKAAFATLTKGSPSATSATTSARPSGARRAWRIGQHPVRRIHGVPARQHPPQKLKRGDIVLVDGGCNLDGYQSDITRTTVFGKPTQRQSECGTSNGGRRTPPSAGAGRRDVRVGRCRGPKVITDAGFGPDYKVPGLPHRTGHGIGMDGHEWTNFVRGNKTPLAPGMCFSDEPMIAIYGEFGIRLEDCLYITEEGRNYSLRQARRSSGPLRKRHKSHVSSQLPVASSKVALLEVALRGP